MFESYPLAAIESFLLLLMVGLRQGLDLSFVYLGNWQGHTGQKISTFESFERRTVFLKRLSQTFQSLPYHVVETLQR